MNNQATTVRAAQQVAAAGCLPDGLAAQSDQGLIGARDPQLVVRSFDSWSGSGAEFSGGDLSGGTDVPRCSTLASNPDAVPQGRYIYLQLRYQQILPLIDALLGVNDGTGRVDVRRGALVVSQSLEVR
jgi:hypothetical protein